MKYIIKSIQQKTLSFLFIAVIVLTSGCYSIGKVTTFTDIKPEYPMPESYSLSTGEIDTCTPTLRWKAKKGITAYDVAVWKMSDNSILEAGERVFYKKQNQGVTCTTSPLLPGTHFLWSVRPSGSNTWSYYNTYFVSTSPAYIKNSYFWFTTPYIKTSKACLDAISAAYSTNGIPPSEVISLQAAITPDKLNELLVEALNECKWHIDNNTNNRLLATHAGTLTRPQFVMLEYDDKEIRVFELFAWNDKLVPELLVALRKRIGN